MIVVTAMPVANANARAIPTKIFFMIVLNPLGQRSTIRERQAISINHWSVHFARWYRAAGALSDRNVRCWQTVRGVIERSPLPLRVVRAIAAVPRR